MISIRIIYIFLFFISTNAWAQNTNISRSNYLDQLIIDAQKATKNGRYYEAYGIANFILDTIPNMPGIDSNYYLGMGLTMNSIPYSHPSRDQKEGLKLLDQAERYNANIQDAQLGFEIASNRTSLLGTLQQFDSAFAQLNKALDIANKHLPHLRFEPLMDISYHYRYFKQPDSALFYLNQVKEYLDTQPFDSTQHGIYYFNLGDYYIMYGGGSAEEMWSKAIEVTPKDDLYNQNLFLSAYAYLQTTKNNFKSAFKYQKKYTHNLEGILNDLTDAHVITLDKKNKELKMITKLRDLELQNEFAKERANIQQKWIRIVSVLALIILIGFVFLYLGFKKQQELNKSLEKAKNKALEVAQLKSDFSETVSHELRTPLHGVIGLTSILISDEKENLSSKGQEYLDSLKFSGDYLLNLINDVLQISKVDAKKLTLENSPFDFKFLISNLSSSFQYLLDKNEVKLNIKVDNQIPQVLIGDAVRLSQIIINLVGNAIKFTKKGEVSLQLKLQELQGDQVSILFEVEDTGIGIPKDKQSEIFEKFTQITNNSSSKGGTGLGLPIVKELLVLHKSEIHLSSELGKGSKFWFTIAFEYSNDQTINNWDVENFEISKEQKKILIVDDNEINRIVSEKILEKYNFDTVLCENGEEALEILAKNSFDIVLMDLHMPKKDGKETIIEFRQIDSTTPVILLTASNIENEWLEFKTLGFTDFIIKPYDRYDFLRKIMKFQ